MTTTSAFSIHPDGSFDLFCGVLSLRRCYPGLDYRVLHPVRVECREDRVTYFLPNGCLELCFSEGNSQSVLLHCRLVDFRVAPKMVAPIFAAEVERATGFYHQGLGFGGPSGITSLFGPAFSPERPLNVVENDRHSFPLTSYLNSALIAEDGQTLAFGALQHGDFLQRTILRRHDYKYGLSNRRSDRHLFHLEVGFSTESIPLPDAELRMPVLQFLRAGSAFEALHLLARDIAESMQCRGPLHSPRAKPPTYHYCSWYHRDYNFGCQELQELLTGLSGFENKPRFDTIQVDASYFPHVGDWLEPCHNFPDTIEEGMRMIQKAGYTPGLWIAPFMVANNSRVAKEHPDWLLRDCAGVPLARWKCYLGGRDWGLPDTEILPLDTSHPEAFAYLRHVFRTFYKWGVRFYKTDFMDWGLYDSETVQRYTPGKTGQRYIRDVMEMIREEIGEESYWLGCILPFSCALGLVDGMRIGNDVPARWTRMSTGNMVQEMLSDQFFNNLWWHNDPDVLYLRDSETFLTEDETRSLAYLATFSGGSVNTSDPIHRVPPDRLKLWRFLEPTPQAFVSNVPDWHHQVTLGQGNALKILTRQQICGDMVVLLFNGADAPIFEELHVENLTGAPRRILYEWDHLGSQLLYDGVFRESFTVRLGPHQSRLFYLAQSPRHHLPATLSAVE